MKYEVIRRINNGSYSGKFLMQFSKTFYILSLLIPRQCISNIIDDPFDTSTL